MSDGEAFEECLDLDSIRPARMMEVDESDILGPLPARVNFLTKQRRTKERRFEQKQVLTERPFPECTPT